MNQGLVVKPSTGQIRILLNYESCKATLIELRNKGVEPEMSIEKLCWVSHYLFNKCCLALVYIPRPCSSKSTASVCLNGAVCCWGTSAGQLTN